jgi:3-methyladenine DNA glycosylase/8-oxoguanine DNA glycosylase
MTAAREAEVTPASPFRMPVFGGEDRVMRISGGIATRLLEVDGCPVLVRAWQPRAMRVTFRAEPVDPDRIADPPALSGGARRPATDADLTLAIERMRFALGVDDDYRAFYDRFRSDRLVGAAVRRRRWHRPRRRPWPWEALAWAITKQLIESSRAAAIQRRMVYRWGAEGRGPDGTTLREVPTPELLADRAPAELAATDLAPARALALIRAAREVVTGRIDPGDSVDDRRLLAIREIGPWTVQCLGLHGRGEPDSLPAGDLAFVKLVGRLVGHRRYATVAEVEEFFAPYAPYRGLAGSFVLAAHHGLVAQGPTLGLAA